MSNSYYTVIWKLVNTAKFCTWDHH